jgi:DNA-directed RNA polymerase sigma subunit (sigma70/sigma32)
VGFVEGDAVLAKQSTIIRIPVGDIERIAEYDKKVLVDKVKNTGKPRIDVAQSVSKILDITLDKARALCKLHKVPLVVDTKFYEDKAIERLKDAIGFREEDDEERKE